MVDLQDSYYDTYDPSSAKIGDGNLTRIVEHPNGTNGLRVTEKFYDWHNRLIASKSAVLLDSNNQFADPMSETNTANIIHRPIIKYTFDNLDEVIQTDQYDGDGIGITSVNGVPTISSTGALRARVTVSFDDQGRPFRTDQFEINQDGTSVGSLTTTNSLSSQTWYDSRGDVMASSQPGGLVSKLVYDGAGRVVTQYLTDGGVITNPSTWNMYSNMGTVSSDIVLQQMETQYDGDGNSVLVTTRQRYHNDATNGAGLGDLKDPSNNPKARVSYQSMYYDVANRPTGSVDWGTLSGTNNTTGTSVISLSSLPTRSGTALVTTFGYQADSVQTVTIGGTPTGGTFTLTFNGQTTGSIAYNATANGTGSVQSALAALSGIGATNVAVLGANGIFSVRFIGALGGMVEPSITASSSLTGGSSPFVSAVSTIGGGDAGRLQQVTNARGTIAKTDYDMLSHTVRSIGAFSTGIPVAATDQTTEYTYDGSGHTLTQKAWVNNSGANNVFQTTAYIYGVTTAGGNGVNSKDILLSVEYPNTSTGNPGTASAFIESYEYDALGEQTKKTQRTGSVHQYTYDPLGRRTSDNVITLGGGVNGTIRRLDYAFDTGGRLFTATSYSNTAGTVIVNQVMRQYNGVGQMTKELQSHSGVVNPTATANVRYTYNEMTDGANNSRPTGIVYPTGSNSVTYDYSGNSGLDNVISRLSALKRTLGTGTNAVTTTVENYDYLGASTVVRVGHPQTGIDLTYEKQTGDTLAGSDAGDIYSGLDRFGRVVDQNYLNTGTAGGSLDRFQYGYDANSNALYRKNLVSSTNSELYHANGTNGYDSLNRLTDFKRGALNSTNDTISSPTKTRTWSLDAQGNWGADASGSAYTTNKENQYTSVATGGCGSATFGYDNDGNLTSRPAPAGSNASANDAFAYDAWDREAQFTRTFISSGGSEVEVAANIDALGRRVQVVTTGTGGLGGVPLPTDDLYYSSSWQVLEDDNSKTANGGSNTGYNQMQFVWSPTYVNDMVLRDRSTAGNGSFDERIYVQHDANHDVTAINDTNGVVKERFVYDPYGTLTVLTSAWAITNDTYNWQYLFQGGRYDSTTGLYTFQRREYDSLLGRWMQPDPWGYVDGGNQYQFLGSATVVNVDPSGLFRSDVHRKITEEAAHSWEDASGRTFKSGKIGGLSDANVDTDLWHFFNEEYHAQSEDWRNWVLKVRHLLDTVETSENAGDVLHAMGVALHGFQDFFSHTDWIEGNSERMKETYHKFKDDALGEKALPGHSDAILSITSFYDESIDLSGTIIYTGGLNPFGTGSLHNRYDVDAPGDGRDLHRRGLDKQGTQIGFVGAFADAYNSAEAQSVALIDWAESHMKCKVHNEIFKDGV